MGRVGSVSGAHAADPEGVHSPPTATPDFIRKWGPGSKADALNERAGAQPHFIDLCQFLGVDAPDDPENYCFERGLWGIDQGMRFADVWKRGHFAWEYKAPGGDLRQALKQLMQYALPLENPPLLIVSDRRTIQINTHFTGHPSLQINIAHDELRDTKKLALLRAVFQSPRTFLPPKTTQQLTAELAGSIARIADDLRSRGVAPFEAAHFLTQCIFCCFAESVEVLPARVFSRLVTKKQSPPTLQRSLTQLFETMSVGGEFGVDTIPWFNGGLFKAVNVPVLSAAEIKTLALATVQSWSAIDPSILGTLFERGLDPGKRSQMGAHYTDAATIERLIDPVVRRPLLAEWDSVKRSISGLMSKRDVLTVRAKGIPSRTPSLKARHGGIRAQAARAQKQAKDLLSGFLDRLQSFRVLDPACGSGNFLFLALKALKDVEHQVNHDAEELGLERQLSVTGPHNVLGIEVNEYAAELARATVWIGELQWRKEHGYGWKENPILDPLDQIEHRDAIACGKAEAAWPAADVVVGNPPFLGNKRMRGELGSPYVDALRSIYRGRVSGESDFVCYWFEKARAHIEERKTFRAGLVATNAIRAGKNRDVLERISRTSRIFTAWANEPWVNDGAAVRVSLVGFGFGSGAVELDGAPVLSIAPDLTAATASLNGEVKAQPMLLNAGACFQGTSKVGKFEIDAEVAWGMLALANPHGRSNAVVVKPWVIARDVVQRPSNSWIIDFGTDSTESEAALYEAPYEYVKARVRSDRQKNNRDLYRRYWWRHGETRAGMRRALQRCDRYIATPRHSKHRLFAWMPATTLPDSAVVVICRSDDATFGVLSSRLHELWSLAMCSWLGVGNDPRYTPTSCFETFPFPEGLSPSDTRSQATEALSDGAVIPSALAPDVRRVASSIARAAKRVVSLRDAWLDPLEWTERVPQGVPLGMKSSPYPYRSVARPGFERDLHDRTLTNLYNQRPTWLSQVHEALDAAVAEAYGWTDYTPAMNDDEILARLLKLNHQRAAITPESAQIELPLPPGTVRGAKAGKTRSTEIGSASPALTAQLDKRGR